jgi:hypothetical protein
LCGYCENGMPYLLYLRLHDSNKHLGRENPVNEIVQDWTKVVEEKLGKKTILCFDSYYMNNTSRHNLIDSGVKYVAATRPDRFKEAFGVVKDGIDKKGDWQGAFNENTGETIVYCFDTEKDIGKKLVFSNAFNRKKKKSKVGLIPVYDHYSCMYNVVIDLTETSMTACGHTKQGGRTLMGTKGIKITSLSLLFFKMCSMHITSSKK